MWKPRSSVPAWPVKSHTVNEGQGVYSQQQTLEKISLLTATVPFHSVASNNSQECILCSLKLLCNISDKRISTRLIPSNPIYYRGNYFKRWSVGPVVTNFCMQSKSRQLIHCSFSGWRCMSLVCPSLSCPYTCCEQFLCEKCLVLKVIC